MRVIVLFSLSLLAVGLVDAKNNNNCPSGLDCKDDRYNPHPQAKGYARSSLATLVESFTNPSTLNLPVLAVLTAPPSLDTEWGTLSTVAQPVQVAFTLLETPLAIRALGLLACAFWNSQTFFFPQVQPLMYSPVNSFPFPSSSSQAFNSTRNRNIALAYASLRFVEYIYPSTASQVAAIMSGAPFNLDPTYQGTSNLNDARDIGNIAAAATIAYAKADGWNSEGTDRPVWTHPFSDQSGFVPANDAYELQSVSRWQPLVETADDGNYIVQQHIFPQARVVPRGWALSRNDMDTTYRTPDNKVPFLNPGTQGNGKLTSSELSLLKSEVDIVLQRSASLNDEKKVLAEFFDAKGVSFGFAPFQNYLDQSFGLMKFLALDFHHLALIDATLVAWSEKIRLNHVRPVSAIRYLYGNTNISAYAGPYAGTQTFPGTSFNSYMRTMPHTEFPSGTACICVAFAEYTERFRGTMGRVDYSWYFPAGSSFREPGTTPATGFVKTFTTSEDFINGCSFTRVDAGVHFNVTVARSIDLCRGIGVKAWEKVYPIVRPLL